jgi:RNA polymerase sigma-70 factor (ECF subfamily)
MPRESEDVTALLREWRQGTPDAAQRLMSAVHQELKRVASAQLRRERVDHTLEPAALVNEVYVRLVGQRPIDWRSRGHFYAIASREMRRILIDHARKRRADKRVGFVGERISLSDVADPAASQEADVLSLHHALLELADVSPRLADVVELRYFGGLTIEEIAAVTSLSAATVKRDLSEARDWLRNRLEGLA